MSNEAKVLYFSSCITLSEILVWLPNSTRVCQIIDPLLQLSGPLRLILA